MFFSGDLALMEIDVHTLKLCKPKQKQLCTPCPLQSCLRRDLVQANLYSVEMKDLLILVHITLHVFSATAQGAWRPSQL